MGSDFGDGGMGDGEQKNKKHYVSAIVQFTFESDDNEIITHFPSTIPLHKVLNSRSLFSISFSFRSSAIEI